MVSFSTLGFRLTACKKRSIVHITGLRRAFVYPELALIHIAKMRKCRVIYDIRDGLELDVARLKRSNSYGRWLAAILKSADLLMIQGETQAPLITALSGREAVLLPNHVDLSSVPVRSYDRSERSAPVLAYAGALRPEKGITMLLETAATLIKRGFEVRVRLAGTGDPAFLRDLQSRYADIDVEWLGAQSSPQVMELFASSHFFVFPTWWPGEGQSNALTEAMACGCVPIASDHGFNAATVGDGGVILSLDESACAYASAIQQIWESGGWEDLSRRSSARVQELYSSVAVIDRLTAQYAAIERGVSQR